MAQNISLSVRCDGWPLQMEESSPTKSALDEERGRRHDKRKALFFSDHQAGQAKRAQTITAAEEPPRVALHSTGTRVSEAAYLRVTAEEEVAAAARELRPTEGAEAAVCGAPLPLPPLALAKPLPAHLQATLEPTALHQMLERDRRLAADVIGGAVPGGTWLVRAERRSPYVWQLLEAGGQGVALLKAPEDPALPKGPPAHKWNEAQELAKYQNLWDLAIVPDFDLQRSDPEEEWLRREVLSLLSDPDLLQPTSWEFVDKWHNVSAQYFNACDQVTWEEARKRPLAPKGPEAPEGQQQAQEGQQGQQQGQRAQEEQAGNDFIISLLVL